MIGLRGTGSDSYSVENLFVPDDRQFDVNVQADHPGLLYRIVNRHLFAPGVAGVALGVSRATLDAFRTAAKDEKKGLRNSLAIQSDLGWMEARWHAARAYVYAALRDAWEDIKAGTGETVEHQIDIRRASTLAIHECKAVVDFAFHEAGASAILDSLPFERRVRDMAGHPAARPVQAVEHGSGRQVLARARSGSADPVTRTMPARHQRNG